MTPTTCIEGLVARGHTVRELEAALGLSHGYLSKVRHAAVTPSPHLQALLLILHAHPETLATVRAATSPPDATPGPPAPPARRRTRSRRTGIALRALEALRPALTAAGVRWVVGGDAALRLLCPGAPESAGVDLVVDDADRHVLAVLRAAGHTLAHHPPSLAIGRCGSSDPDEVLRVHFPARPPLTDAWSRAVEREGLPVVDLETLTLANLLSQRSGAEEAAAVALRAGVSVDALRARLEALAGLPEPRSPYVLRTFDRALALRRLG